MLGKLFVSELFVASRLASGRLSKCKDSDTKRDNCNASSRHIQGALRHTCQNRRQNCAQERREHDVHQQLKERDAGIAGGVDEAVAIALPGEVRLRQRRQREHARSQRRSPDFHASLRIRSYGKLARRFTDRRATPLRDEPPTRRNL
jgi:hypothetical protein